MYIDIFPDPSRPIKDLPRPNIESQLKGWETLVLTTKAWPSGIERNHWRRPIPNYIRRCWITAVDFFSQYLLERWHSSIMDAVWIESKSNQSFAGSPGLLLTPTSEKQSFSQKDCNALWKDSEVSEEAPFCMLHATTNRCLHKVMIEILRNKTNDWTGIYEVRSHDQILMIKFSLSLFTCHWSIYVTK